MTGFFDTNVVIADIYSSMKDGKIIDVDVN